ncbi:MAG: zinc ribbon-containing protein, partial [Candidatus Sedimenticola sp. (ex Thyasira tokunagai)]
DEEYVMTERDPVDRLVNAYEKMLEQVDEMLDKAEKNTLPKLRKSIDTARDKMVEMNELTREEAEKIGGYLERDMKDAAHFLNETGDEFRNWYKFDVELIEARMMELFAKVADRTRLEMERFTHQMREASMYHTGEITGPGTLICTKCGKELHFHKTGRIPPCGKCHATEFERGGD